MEFTKLLKYGSASLFLVLLAHGLILGFSNPTTIISIVLLLICFAMEQKLVLSEREALNTKFIEILTTRDQVIDDKLIEQNKVFTTVYSDLNEKNAEVQKKLDSIHSQMNMVKTAQGMTRKI